MTDPHGRMTEREQNPSTTRVTVWGSRNRPRWTVSVAESTSREEIERLVEEAVRAFRLVHTKLGEPDAPDEDNDEA